MKRLTMATTLMLAALTTTAWAQTPSEHSAHDHSGGAKSAPAPSDAAPPANPPAANAPQGGMGGMGGSGGMPMMGMMNDMKNTMNEIKSSMSAMQTMGMMQTMRMMGAGMGGMATIDRVEGRIAFLKAELKITDAQASAWNDFADALRANARKLGEARAAVMAKPGAAPTLPESLDRQEQWLAARLEGTRAMKSAFAKLNETLSEEQRKAANDLMAPHLGMGTMAMMRSQMQPGR